MRRSRFSEEQIVRVLREVEEGRRVGEVCRKHGISEHTYFRWRKKFAGMEVSDVRRLRELEVENQRLKKLVAERDLEIEVMREIQKKKW